jgi:putative acetyltransferase
MHGVRILPGDLSDPKVLRLLPVHLAGMRAITPPGSVYALDVAALQAPGLTLWTAWLR